MRYVKSILRQEIAYFDEISAGSVATKIATNINLIHIGMGEKIGIAVQGEWFDGGGWFELIAANLDRCWAADFCVRGSILAAVEAYTCRGYNRSSHLNYCWGYGYAGFES